MDIVIPPMRASCGGLAGIDAQESMSNPFKCSPPRPLDDESSRQQFTDLSTLVHHAEMRVAETRAVKRALRKAYGIGICSVEEIVERAANPSW
jgi:hypothetical protein